MQVTVLPCRCIYNKVIQSATLYTCELNSNEMTSVHWDSKSPPPSLVGRYANTLTYCDMHILDVMVSGSKPVKNI